MAKIETKLTDAQVKIAEALFAMKPVVTIGKRAGTPQSTEIPLGEFPEAAILKIMAYGAQRVFNDAVGGSDTDQAAKVATVRKMIDDFKKGIVGRAASEGVDAVTAGIRAVIKSKLKAGLPKEKWAKFEALDAKAQNTKLDEYIAKQGEEFQTKVRTTVETKLAQRAAEKQALANLAVDFDL